jgi:hypothetical protein
MKAYAMNWLACITGLVGLWLTLAAASAEPAAVAAPGAGPQRGTAELGGSPHAAHAQLAGYANSAGDQFLPSSVAVAELTTDWRRTAVFGLLGILLVLLLLFIGKLLFRLALLFVCVAGGVGASAFLTATLEPLIARRLPPVNGHVIRADLLAAIAAFLIGYVVTCALLGILLKPLRLGKKR